MSEASGPASETGPRLAAKSYLTLGEWQRALLETANLDAGQLGIVLTSLERATELNPEYEGE